MMQVKSGKIKMLCILLLLCILLPANAAAKATSPDSSERVLRVFFPLQYGFAQQNEQGAYSGYTYEYLMKIAQLTGWKYEFVSVEATNENLQAGLDAVKSGDIDLVAGMVQNPALEQAYAYSAIPSGETHFSLICPESNKTLNKRTLLDVTNLKVALVENATQQNQLFDQYCAENGVVYQPLYAKSTADCRELVRSGQADAMISKDVISTEGFQTVVKFAPQPFYFATAKENSELMAEISKVMTAIDIADSSFQDKLYQKYFTKPSDYNIALTAEEMAYVAAADVISVIVPINRAPIQSYDEKTGEFSGIIVDILDIIAEKSGLHFALIPAETSEEMVQLLEDKTGDMVAGISYFYDTAETSSRMSLLRTSPIFTSPIVRVSGNASNTKYEEILVARSIKVFDGQANIKYVDDIDELFSLIDTYEYKSAYVNGYIAQHYLEKNLVRNVSITPTPYSNYDLCLGVVRDCDLRLMGVLEQAIASILPSEVEDIVYQNTTHHQQLDLLDVIRKNPLPFTISIVIVFAVILTLVFSLFLKTRKINKFIFAEKNRYKAISQMDQLTQAYNNEAFKQLSRNYLAKAGAPPFGALIVSDIDNFKTINDTFGHLVGDQVIHRVGQLFLTVFRESDIVGRLGGDEFMVLLKDTSNLDIIKKRCEELLLHCKAVNDRQEITLSIGIVTFSGAVDFEELFQQADTALYEVKSNGKNAFKFFS